MSKIIFTLMFLTFVLATPFSQAKEWGEFYAGGGIGVVFAGNTRADGVFESTGTPLDGQRLGPMPGETAKGYFDSSLATSLTIGYKLADTRLRFEGEWFYQNADTKKYKGILNGNELNPAGQVATNISGIVLNALYDFEEFYNIKPYIYLGFGQASVETEYDFRDEGRVDIDGNSQIIQGGVGMELFQIESMTFDVKYRFRRAGLNEDGLDADIDAQILELGIRFAF